MMVPGNARFFLYEQSMNMRKSFEGLGTAIEQFFPGELLSGAYFIFLNRKRDHIKILYWDSDGLAIWYKRLEKGSFPRREKGAPSINRREFLMLLEGITPKRLNPRYTLK